MGYLLGLQEYLEETYNNTCILCYADANHPHHIVFTSAGGSDDKENIVPLCSGCHQSVHEQDAQVSAQRIRAGAKLVRAVYEN